MATDPEIRAQVEAALLAGLGVREVARQLKLPPATVQRFKNALKSERLEQIGTEKRNRIDDLLVSCLQEHLEGMNAIAKVTREPGYLQGQTAADLAKLHEELKASAFSLLESASAAGVETEEGEES